MSCASLSVTFDVHALNVAFVLHTSFKHRISGSQNCAATFVLSRVTTTATKVAVFVDIFSSSSSHTNAPNMNTYSAHL